MIKSMWKIALVAHICVATVFVLTAVLNMMGWGVEVVEGGLLSAAAIVMFVLYVLLSAYLLYVAFASKPKLKRVLLFSDCASATSANGRVIDKIVRACAKHSDGLHVNKARVTEDDHSGFVLTVHVSIKSGEAQKAIDKMRCLLQDSFTDTLGLQFNSVNFVIDKLAFTPDVARVNKKANELTEQRKQAQEQYFAPACDCANCTTAPENGIKNVNNDTLTNESVAETNRSQAELVTEQQVGDPYANVQTDDKQGDPDVAEDAADLSDRETKNE